MDIKEILKTNANVTIAVTANDLRNWHKEIIEDTRCQLENAVIEGQRETYLTAKQVSVMLSVDLSTLWRWQKRGYLVPVMAGGERRYKQSDINLMLEGK